MVSYLYIYILTKIGITSDNILQNKRFLYIKSIIDNQPHLYMTYTDNIRVKVQKR